MAALQWFVSHVKFVETLVAALLELSSHLLLQQVLGSTTFDCRKACALSDPFEGEPTSQSKTVLMRKGPWPSRAA